VAGNPGICTFNSTPSADADPENDGGPDAVV
jgi:hypothetical protein